MLSRKAKYGLIACIDLTRHYERGPRLIADIAKDEELPRKFLELILLELKNAGFLDSKKGKGGGYQLAKSPHQITIGGIIRAIDGPLAPVRCASVTAPVPCEECLHPEWCGIRLVMRDTRDAIASVLDNTTLAEVMSRSDTLREKTGKADMFYI